MKNSTTEALGIFLSKGFILQQRSKDYETNENFMQASRKLLYTQSIFLGRNFKPYCLRTTPSWKETLLATQENCLACPSSRDEVKAEIKNLVLSWAWILTSAFITDKVWWLYLYLYLNSALWRPSLTYESCRFTRVAQIGTVWNTKSEVQGFKREYL